MYIYIYIYIYREREREGFQGCGLSVLRVGHLAPRIVVCVVVRCLAILRIEGCLNNTLLTVFLESPRQPPCGQGLAALREGDGQRGGAGLRRGGAGDLPDGGGPDRGPGREPGGAHPGASAAERPPGRSDS